jgi:hypothetical protein
MENSLQLDNNISNAELCARISRDLRRLLQLLKMPMIISPALSLPEALIFNTVGSMLINCEVHAAFDKCHVSIGLYYALSQHRYLVGAPSGFLLSVDQWLDITLRMKV